MITTINEWKKYKINESFNFSDNDLDKEIMTLVKLYENEEYYYLQYYYENQNMFKSDATNDETEIYELVENHKEEYLEWLNEELYYKVYDIVDIIKSSEFLYRAITVPKTFNIDDIDKNGLGIYWSYDKDAAEPHWGYSMDNLDILTIVAQLDDKSIVNVQETLKAGTRPYTGEDEKEITLIKGKDIFVREILINEKKINIGENKKI